MKKQMIPGCVVLVLALIIAVGSVTFLGPCVNEDGSAGACTWASRSILGLGLLMAFLSLSALLFRKARYGLYLSLVLTGILGILTPGTLISLCRMSTMRCRAVMQPAAIILFAAAALAALAGLLILRREEKGKA